MGDSTWVSTSMPYLTPREQGQPDAWGVEAAARGGKGSQRIVQAGEVPAPEEVAALLDVPVGETVVVRRRIIQLDDEPCELTDTYYPARVARGTPLARKGKIPGGAVTLLAELGHIGRRVREDVTARLPSAEERDALQLAPDAPVLTLSRVTLDGEDRPLQVDMMVMPAHRQRLRYEMRIG
ncbi:GntR family transcriptional regulator [Streptomyces lavenduligriseus]|uniref:UTRA domain-containing protein n=1 Tax=Streptomyces lavenduligriseus TaxID=67315 RepID=A0ABT0P4H8_9ACTN|nr:UTRA domain-containing protein [Streptomyces lavenduligriseus]MCL3998481.1 UTRA domain-containing protein [Streptomyces lavenduligriseus]